MISNEGKIALKSYIGNVLYFLALGITIKYLNISSLPVILIVFLICAVISIVLQRTLFIGKAFQIAIRAGLLGFIFALGIYVNFATPPHIQIFGIYMSVMAFFHFSEYVAISVVQPKQLTTDSFMLNHSPQYIVAALSSWTEFFVEAYLFPGMKQYYFISYVGLVICILGEILRKVSMLTAGSSFHHLVQCEKSNDHILITHGVYSWFRHPSYVGWFYWSIGTQIILVNPICIPAYTIASWMFFKSRIYIEEITLLNFFGQNYCDYQAKVGTGLFYIDGYRI